MVEVMDHRPRSGAERLGRMFEREFDLDRDQENTAMLFHDIRRVAVIAMVVVSALAVALMVSGSPGPGGNLLLIESPILALFLIGEWLRRRAHRHD